MIVTALTPMTNLSRLSRKIRRAAGQSRSLQVKASDVDSYGDYDLEQIGELPANLAGVNPNPSILDGSGEEFESLYQWFLS
jgi:hypothetical protein